MFLDECLALRTKTLHVAIIHVHDIKLRVGRPGNVATGAIVLHVVLQFLGDPFQCFWLREANRPGVGRVHDLPAAVLVHPGDLAREIVGILVQRMHPARRAAAFAKAVLR